MNSAKLKKAAPPAKKKSQQQPSGNGATEDEVDMAATLPQHSDDHGTKVEDEAGTGEIDSLGG